MNYPPSLAALAASDFDPDDYKRRPGAVRGYCDHCRVRYAPGGVCGYCRGRVKMLRAETAARVFQCHVPEGSENP